MQSCMRQFACVDGFRVRFSRSIKLLHYRGEVPLCILDIRLLRSCWPRWKNSSWYIFEHLWKIQTFTTLIMSIRRKYFTVEVQKLIRGTSLLLLSLMQHRLFLLSSLSHLSAFFSSSLSSSQVRQRCSASYSPQQHRYLWWWEPPEVAVETERNFGCSLSELQLFRAEW